MVELEGRSERFAREMAGLRIEDPSPGRHGLWLRVGGAAMGLGLLISVAAFFRAQGTTDPLVQRDSLALGIAGVATCIVGAAVYVRYAVTKVLRFWIARISFDLQQYADRKADL